MLAFLQHAHNVECPSRLGTWRKLSPLRRRSAGLCLGVAVWRVLRGHRRSEGWVDAVLGQTACLAAGLLNTTDDGPPAGWEDVLPDAMLAMARGQSGYIPVLRSVWSAIQTRRVIWSIWTSWSPTVRLAWYMLQLVCV